MAAETFVYNFPKEHHYGPFVLKVSTVLAALGILLALRFIKWYFKALRQFPGPPVRSFWTGNLDQTMTDDIHEKWRTWHVQYGPVFQTVSIPRLCSIV